MQPCNVLLVYPRFEEASFWNYSVTAEVLGARYPTIPLGLITLAALLPAEWAIRLINRNTEALSDEDLAWADVVMTGGMLFQQVDTLKILRLAKSFEKPTVVGGPDATSSPHVYAEADFRVLGEAEGIIDRFVQAWNDGQRRGDFSAQKFKADVSMSPVPRFDLLKFEDYLHVGVQFSRGCPFTCEFCDIIELYGRVPRTKTPLQMLAELEALYQLGYRGHVDFVDDNLIGNKKAVRAFLPHLQAWQEAHGFPFMFSTEASINIADHEDLLSAMKACNFFALFVGIESPDPVTLAAIRKKQNTRRNLVENIHLLYDYGMFVTAGFILGFDSETGSVADPMIELIEKAAIPVAMVGLLYALPNTQLTRRLTGERRLFEGFDTHPENSGDQCSRGLNFITARDRRSILEDYHRVVTRIYEPDAYLGRVEAMVARLSWARSPHQFPVGDPRRRKDIEAVERVINCRPDLKEQLTATFARCYKINPAAVRQVVALLAIYLHLGTYAQKVASDIRAAIDEIDSGQFSTPSIVTMGDAA
ncbi:B12-binding domain-containing radical SAM protein [Hyphomicrobium sp. CS1GBMeth3]|uniref:B12-binding domain-containing radical SAM protein n=1 Tax=Hyphomicrobium sp. CS1GBMeth3 TaxID=1892845 RepID=UPI0009317363|nr:B12-binding domain-containing radical SAM protein [Hyphomicrobium sp. CS1GBMeth3]